eukprot:2013556-Pyramimonas_sp.AAC.1
MTRIASAPRCRAQSLMPQRSARRHRRDIAQTNARWAQANARMRQRPMRAGRPNETTNTFTMIKA